MNCCVRVTLLTVPLLLLTSAIANAEKVASPSLLPQYYELTKPIFALSSPSSPRTEDFDSSSTPKEGGAREAKKAGLLHPIVNTTALEASNAIAQVDISTPISLATSASGISKAARDLLPIDRPIVKVTAQAETAPPNEKPAKPTASEEDTAKLAEAAQNPIANLISVPFQNNFNFGVGPDDQTQYVLNVQPVIPVSLSPRWLVVNRIITPIVNQPTITINPPSAPGLPPNVDTGYSFGLGDINPQFYFVPKNTGNITWGIGPQFSFPTATTDVTGAGKWSVGPVGVIVYTHSHWVVGALATQLWSFAGDRDRQAVSQFLLQPFINYNLPKGWYITTSPQVTANWMAEPGEQWTLPLGGGVGKLFKIGKQPINASLQAYGNVIKPENGPDWLLRFQIQLLFPTGGR